MNISLAPILAPKLPFYYGWVVVNVVSIVGFAAAAFMFGVVGALFEPMSREFGWDRTVVPGAVLVGSVLVIFVGPLSGRLIDRYGPRFVVVVGSLIMVACLVALGWTSSIAMFYVLFSIGYASFTGTANVSQAAITAKWFVRRRGIASAVSGVGGPLGFVALPVLAVWATEMWTWRAGWIAMGAVVFAVAVPASLLFLARSPEEVGQRVDGEREGAPATPGEPGRRTAATEVQWTAKEAMRTPTLWLLLAALCIRGFAQSGVQLHLIPHLLDRGLSPAVAVTQFAIGGTVMAVSGFFWGPLTDRLSMRKVYVLGSALFIAYVAAIMAADSLAIVIVVGLLQGVTIGATVMLQRVAYANFFGRRSAGAIQGIVVPFQMITMGSGGLAAGALYTLTGDYTLTFQVFIGLTILGTILAIVVPTPVKRSDAVAPAPGATS